MHIRADSLDEEIRVTVDAGVELTNEMVANGDLRAVLVEHDFIRAGRATASDVDELRRRFRSVRAIIETLPDIEPTVAVDLVNAQLRRCSIAPSLSAHDGFALHIHWTGDETSFGRRVVVDVLMALAQTLCDHGTDRFGRCAAEGCERLFYDATKNRSRRFCSDSRCASRTHTAEHRARRRDAG